MKTIHAVICAVTLAALPTGIQCTKSPVSNNGSGSTTETALVRGILYLPDGHTPAAGVRVHIRPEKTLADTAGTALAKKLAVLAATDSVVTDSAGQYAFDTTLDTGTYVIEATNGNNAALIDSVAVKTKTTTDTLAPDTLKPAGALKGVIKLSEGGDPRKVFVLAFGIDRFARVNADGSFKFSGLAEAKYDLRLISSLDNYGVLDTNAIPVVSADTTNLDTISLPFTGIPTPKNVKISYDTLKQIVTLMWDSANASLVASYDIYRRNVGLNTVPARINSNPVIGTVYRDSTGVQDSTYEYMVAAVDRSTTEGTKSAGVNVTVVSVFTFIKNFGQQGTGTGQFIGPADIATDKNGNYWIADLNRNKILKFDSSGSFLLEWGVAGTDSGQLNNPYGLDIDPNGNIIVNDYDGTRVQKFDTLGNLVLHIDSSGIQIKDVSADENGCIYFSMATGGNPNYICKYSSDGRFLKSWQLQSMFLHYALLARRGKVYCAGTIPSSIQHPADQEVIEVFDTTGTPIQTVDIRQSRDTGVILIRDLDIDIAGNLYAADPESGKVRVFDSNLNYVTSFGRKGNGTADFFSIQGIAINVDKRIAITDNTSIVHLLKMPW
jgi:hypothetical protein